MNTKNKNIISIVVLFGLLVMGFQNCSKMQFTDAAKLSELSSESTGSGGSSALHSQSLTFSVAEQINPQVDILFIMDNSGSMVEEQGKVANAFSTFISYIPHLDWRIAITTTDNSDPNKACKSGNLCPLISGSNLSQDENKYYLTPNTPNANSIFMDKINVGTSGSGQEKAFDSIRNFTKNKKEDYQQFIRPNASLVTIIVSDSDQSSSYTPESFVSDIHTHLGQKNYTNYSSIVLPGDTTCRNIGENYGPKYYKASQLTGGFSVSICEENYAQQFAMIANSITQSIDQKTLNCAPADANADGYPDVTVTGPNGHLITSFTVAGNKVKFTPSLNIAGSYTIDYFCRPE